VNFKIQRGGKVVAEADVKHLRGGDYELAWIGVVAEWRSKGLANTLLEKAKSVVTAKGNLLVAFLEPRKGGLTHEQMAAWLKRHGFKHGRYAFDWNAPTKRVMLWEAPAAVRGGEVSAR